MTTSSECPGRSLRSAAGLNGPHTVSSHQLARVRGMAAINATSTSNTDSSASLDARPFRPRSDPGRYYDLC